MNKAQRAYLRRKSGRGVQRAWRRGRNRNLTGHLCWFGSRGCPLIPKTALVECRGDLSRIGEILTLARQWNADRMRPVEPDQRLEMLREIRRSLRAAMEAEG